MSARHMFMQQVLALLRKELVLMWLDPGTRNVLIFPIIIQCVIFGYAATFNLSQVPYAILSLSDDALAAELAEDLALNPSFELVAVCRTQHCLNESLEHEQALLGIYISRSFRDDRQLQVIADARSTASASIAYTYLTALIGDFNVSHGLSRSVVNTRFIYNENTITRFSVLTGMILSLSMLQVLILASLTVSREREEGTFDMMLMTPTPTYTLLIGKAAAPILVSCLQSCLLFLICRYYFEIPFRGDYLSLLGAIFIFASSLVGLGLAISAIAATTQQSIIIAFVFLMPMIITSSLLTPIDSAPDWFMPLVYINPLYYGIDCMRCIYLEGRALPELWDRVLPLLLLAAVTLARCAWLFRHHLK